MTERIGPTEEMLKAMSGNEVAFVFLNPLNELYMSKVSRSRVFRLCCYVYYTAGCTSCSAIRHFITHHVSHCRHRCIPIRRMEEI